MARTPLAAPTVTLGPGPSTGLILPATETLNLTGFTGVSFANNGAIMLRLVVGAAGVGTLSVIFQRGIDGAIPVASPIAVANSTTYIFGPWAPSNYNDVNGLVQIDKTGTVTGDSAGLYFLAGARV